MNESNFWSLLRRLRRVFVFSALRNAEVSSGILVICFGLSLFCSCAAKIEIRSVWLISPLFKTARYNTLRACFPRMGTASMLNCKSLFSG